ncbi:peptidase inhibitor family I36 protein [Nostoc sp. CHAB 5836]|uniref:beta/gamma crystallin-related protein n=1 Tax=Nostoc sp. CHAB 5836 TaxID=2780404 RepID=UPI001E65B77A|nr:beta/gamma crystallin-related protein [Nostoc sp. CHAB 5836]MCC5615875.1 peptidase inhibitor family I36 protein [Nostoc sp. CHAB 5836]
MKTIEMSSLYSEMTSEEAETISGAYPFLKVYEDINFRGDSWETADSYDYVGRRWNDRISSIKIFEGTWTFYADANRTGFSRTLGPGNYSWVENVGISNDSISSFYSY